MIKSGSIFEEGVEDGIRDLELIVYNDKDYVQVSSNR